MQLMGGWRSRLRDSPANRQIAGVAAVAVLVGVAGGWAWDSSEPTRDAGNDLIIKTGTDPSTYVLDDGTPVGFTVPVRNDSTFPVTVTFLQTPGIPKSSWRGANRVIPPGVTQDLAMTAPPGCAASAVPGKTDAPVTVHLIVASPNNTTHKITFTLDGVIQAIAHQCGQPYPSTVAF
jgi:hypothetical protein